MQALTVNDLPSEIHCKVFLEALNDTNPHTFSNDNSFKIPLCISHVCRRWRKESLSFGSLWSYLCVEQGPSAYTWYGVRRRESIKNIFDTWLQRTNKSPLNFKLHYNLPRISRFASIEVIEIHRLVEYMITSMLSQQHRWRDVDFEWIGLRCSSAFPGIHATNMPILSSLTLSVLLDLHKADAVSCANVSIARSTRLKSLRISGNYNLDLGQEPISTLKGPCFFQHRGLLERVDKGIYANFLKIAPNLEELDIRFNCGSHNRYEVPATIVLEKLRILRLTLVGSFVPSLTLPALEAFSLHYIGNNCNDYSTGGQSLLKFIQRSVPPLRHLDIDDRTTNKTTLLPILHLLPALEGLRLLRPLVPTWLFEALTLKEDCSEADSIVCPRLSSFRLSSVNCPRDDTVYLDAFCAMLESRWKVLRTFGIVWDDSDDEWDRVDVPLTSDGDILKLRSFFEESGDVLVGGNPIDNGPFYA